MSDELNLECFNLSDYQSRQCHKWARDAPEKIPLWVADMDFPIAPPIRRALEGVIANSDLGYPPPSLEERLIGAFARWSKTRYGLDVDPELTIVATDVIQALYFAFVTLSEPGDGVLVLTPAYPPYFVAHEQTGRKMVTHALELVDGVYRFDIEAIRALVRSERPRLMLLCNPHNPTGRVFTREELIELASVAEEYDLVILSDEVHGDLVYPGATHVPIATLGADVAQRTITMNSASKTFNLAGLRCAVAACGTPQLAERITSIPRRQRGSINNLGMIAALAGWEEGGPWLDAVLAYLENNRDRVLETLSDVPGVSCAEPQATYLAWLDLRASGLGDDPAAVFAEQAGVTLLPGPDFGGAGKGYARLNFATTVEVLDSGLERLRTFLVARS
ncbi:MAG: PatB family C-S lyase [Acidimicrobiales bacterium]